MGLTGSTRRRPRHPGPRITSLVQAALTLHLTSSDREWGILAGPQGVEP